MNSRQQGKRKSRHSMSKTIQQQKKKITDGSLTAKEAKIKLEGLVIPPDILDSVRYESITD